MSSMIHNLLAGMTPREKRLALLMISITLLFIVFVIDYLVDSSIVRSQERVTQSQGALKLLREKEGEYYAKRDAEKQLNQLDAPKPLRTLIDNVVQKVKISEPDTKEMPDQNYPGGWLERSMELNFAEVELVPLVRFMEELSSNRTRFPIAITKLEVRRARRGKPYHTTKMTISTYERTGRDDAAQGSRGGR
ncbi:MAG: hypothetical protein GX146_07920 [Myxococcales bacterium]|nr:hypothetical protein [Myxococcales bacterium]